MPVLIGIAGGSGSGKSFLATELKKRLQQHGGCSLLSMDHYYFGVPPEQAATTNFDRIEAIEVELYKKHLEQLRNGATIHRPKYNFITHCREEQLVPVPALPFVIADGIMLLAVEPLRSLFHMTVFVDLDPRTRLERRLARDTHEEGERQRDHAQAIAQWDTTVQPFFKQTIEPTKQLADVVLTGRFGDTEVESLLQRCLSL